MKEWTNYLILMVALAVVPLLAFITWTAFPSLGRIGLPEYLGLAGLGLSLYLAMDKLRNLKPFVRVKFVVQPADRYAEPTYVLKAEYAGSSPVVLDLAGLAVPRKSFCVPWLIRRGMLNRATLRVRYHILLDRDVLTAALTTDDRESAVRRIPPRAHSGFGDFWTAINNRTLSIDNPEVIGILCTDELRRIVQEMNLSGVIRIVGFFRDTKGYNHYSEPMKYQVEDVTEHSQAPQL